MTLTGVVSKVNWQNPHVYVYLDVSDAGGKTTTYALECNSVNTLLHKGWTRDALKKGDKVIISAFGPKDTRPLADGSIHANARSITFADGHSVSAGSSAGEEVK
jgi:prepilin-type processing-associated H-X9-DG protein